MNLGAENKKKMIIAVVIGVVAIGALGYNLSGFFTGTPAPPPPPVIKTTSTTNTHESAAAPSPMPAPAAAVSAGKASQPIATTAAQLDPTLQMEGMLEAESLMYDGSGRNIFSTQSAPPPTPKPIAPPRPRVFVGPPAPVPPPPPPPPPPILLKFFGTEMSKKGVKRAFLIHEEDVYLAAPGDIIDRRYKVVNVLTNSVVITDMPNNDTQSLPLVQ